MRGGRPPALPSAAACQGFVRGRCLASRPHPTSATNTNTILSPGVAPPAQVTLKSTVSTVVVTTLVLEGWSSRLHPDLSILDTLRDALGADWRARISKTVDRIMTGDAQELAVA